MDDPQSTMRYHLRHYVGNENYFPLISIYNVSMKMKSQQLSANKFEQDKLHIQFYQVQLNKLLQS